MRSLWSRVRERPFAWVYGVTIVTHLVLFLLVVNGPRFDVDGTDGPQYQRLAENVLAGNGFSLHTQPPYVPDVIRTPAYPVFLAGVKAVFGSYRASLWAAMLIGTLVPLCGMVVMRTLTDDRRLWIATGLILALDPNVWYYSFIFGSEAVAVPLMAGALSATAVMLKTPSMKSALLAGGLMGAAALGRPIVQFVPFLLLVMAAWLYVRRVESRTAFLKAVTVWCATFVLIASPWIIRNVRHFGVAEFSNVGWFNMYTRVAATAEALATGRPYNDLRIELLQRLHDKGYVAKTPVEELDVFGFEFREIFVRETLAIIRRYPKEFVISQISAGLTIVSQDATVRVVDGLGWLTATQPPFAPTALLLQRGPLVFAREIRPYLFSAWSIAMVMRVVWLAVLVLACVAPVIAAERGKRRRGDLTSLFLILYCLAIIALSLNIAAQASGRYRSQYLVAQTPLTLLAVKALRDWRRERRHRLCISPNASS